MKAVISRWKDSRKKRGLAKKKTDLAELQILSNETDLLEGPLLVLTDREIQLLIRDIDPELLAAAAAGASGVVQSRLLEMMGDRGQILFLKDLDYFRGLGVDSIIKAQGEVLAYLSSGNQK